MYDEAHASFRNILNMTRINNWKKSNDKTPQNIEKAQNKNKFVMNNQIRDLQFCW